MIEGQQAAAHAWMPIRFTDGQLILLDQRLLPRQELYLTLTTVTQVADAIRKMVVRGAPALATAAAYGVVIAAQRGEDVHQAVAQLKAARPTAVNLFNVLDRMLLVERSVESLLDEANAVAREDAAACLAMSRAGADVVLSTHTAQCAADCIDDTDPLRVYTHCNTGALATSGQGTALGVVRELAGRVNDFMCFAGETRPWLQGARLTSWELQKDGVPVTLCADSAAAQCIRDEGVSWVIVGADRITAAGDVFNKVGTSQLAMVAKTLGVKFMVVASVATIDWQTTDSSAIEIEQRGAEEVLSVAGTAIAPDVPVYNPVFDQTNAEWIDVLVTEHGVVHQPNIETMRAFKQHLQDSNLD